MKDGQKLVFHGEGDQEPDLEPGDVIIVLDQKDHSVFQRRGNDLVMKMKIQLTEALCGFKKTIETLDDRVLLISSKPGKLGLLGACACVCVELHYILSITFHLPTGEVIKHGDIKCIVNEGMPIYKSPLEKGSLIIQFLVSKAVAF